MGERNLVSAALQSTQVPISRYLWVPADAIIFTPQVLDEPLGDGRALFAFGTINSRPAYWIVRGDSSWSVESDYGEMAPDETIDFGERSEEVLCALEEQFGRAGWPEEYEYNSVGKPYDVETGRLIAWSDITYPVVNTGGGWHWGRLDWPDLADHEFVAHPLHPTVRLLVAPVHKDEGL